MVSILVTFVVFGVCMLAMAVGLIVKGKLLCKDCGLDPMTGERIGHCSCAEAREQNSFSQANPSPDARCGQVGRTDGSSKVIPLKPGS